jgi:hypothetical protein
VLFHLNQPASLADLKSLLHPLNTLLLPRLFASDKAAAM